MEILLHDFLDRIIEYRHRSFHSGLRVRICDGRHSTVLAGIVEVHPADLLSGTLLYKVCVDMQLTSVTLKLLQDFFDIVLHQRLEIHDFDGISLTANKVNLTLNDVVWLYQGNVDLGLLYL